MAQPLKKAPIKKGAALSNLKEKLGIKTKVEKGKIIGASNADKPMEWLLMPPAFQDALKLPGIPQNFVSLVVGHSNSGKSTLINHAIVAAQRQGLIPVIFDTENNFDFTYAMDMGMEAEPIYEDVEVEVVDPETGTISTEVRNMVTSYDGNFLYFNNTILADRYGKIDYSTGKENTKGRKVAVIEDISKCINELLNAQDEGEIESGFVFIWDSIGSISCYKSYKSATNNAMWDAGALSTAFNTIVNDRIPRSRKVTSPYNNTFLAVNKVWLDSMSNPMPGAPPSLSLKGGNSMFYSARLIILCGGQLKASVKKLTAKAKGLTYNFAIQSKLKVLKNQLPNPFTVTYEGDVICTPHGMISTDNDALESYKKEYVSDILKHLNEINTKEGITVDENSEITYDIEETEEIG